MIFLFIFEFVLGSGGRNTVQELKVVQIFCPEYI